MKKKTVSPKYPKSVNLQAPSCTSLEPCHLTIIFDDDGNIVFFGCANGEGDCFAAKIAGAEVSNFHDDDLKKAAKAMEDILAGIPPDPDGRTLSFISTTNGFLLAWVEHGLAIPKDAKVITQKSVGAKAFAKTLKIKSPKK